MKKYYYSILFLVLLASCATTPPINYTDITINQSLDEGDIYFFFDKEFIHELGDYAKKNKIDVHRDTFAFIDRTSYITGSLGLSPQGNIFYNIIFYGNYPNFIIRNRFSKDSNIIQIGEDLFHMNLSPETNKEFLFQPYIKITPQKLILNSSLETNKDQISLAQIFDLEPNSFSAGTNILETKNLTTFKKKYPILAFMPTENIIFKMLALPNNKYDTSISLKINNITKANAFVRLLSSPYLQTYAAPLKTARVLLPNSQTKIEVTDDDKISWTVQMKDTDLYAALLDSFPKKTK